MQAPMVPLTWLLKTFKMGNVAPLSGYLLNYDNDEGCFVERSSANVKAANQVQSALTAMSVVFSCECGRELASGKDGSNSCEALAAATALGVDQFFIARMDLVCFPLRSWESTKLWKLDYKQQTSSGHPKAQMCGGEDSGNTLADAASLVLVVTEQEARHLETIGDALPAGFGSTDGNLCGRLVFPSWLVECARAKRLTEISNATAPLKLRSLDSRREEKGQPGVPPSQTPDMTILATAENVVAYGFADTEKLTEIAKLAESERRADEISKARKCFEESEREFRAVTETESPKTIADGETAPAVESGISSQVATSQRQLRFWNSGRPSSPEDSPVLIVGSSKPLSSMEVTLKCRGPIKKSQKRRQVMVESRAKRQR
eukprot:Polyplicarium_translucidae@DN1777_c0_g1_i4.p1